jgi:hypothetical protein
MRRAMPILDSFDHIDAIAALLEARLSQSWIAVEEVSCYIPWQDLV